MKTYIKRPMIWTNKFARLTFGGIIPGGPGSDKGSALRLKFEANWFILWEDSSMASDERLSSVTRSTEIENKVLIFQFIETIGYAIKKNPLLIYLR